MVELKGYQGVLQRMQEIQSQIDQVSGRQEKPPQSSGSGSFEATLQGAIGQHQAQSLVPMDPFAPQGNSSKTSDSQLRALATSTAQKYGIDPKLFAGLIEQESGFNPKEVSSKGAIGLTQLMPGTAQALGVNDPTDPAQNLEGGAKYLRQMMNQFGGDARLALAAYNAGPGAVLRHGGVPPFPETQAYVARVLANAEQGGRR